MLLFLAACSSNNDETNPGASASLEIQGTDGVTVVLEQLPQRIVSLAPHATEIFCVLGAGDRLVAVDSFENCPAGSSEKPELDSFQPSVEAIAAQEPDLVYMFYDPGDIASSLRGLDITTLVLDVPEEIDGIYANIELIGEMTQREDEAEALIARMRSQQADVLDGIDAGEGPTYYHELDNTFFTVRSDTFIGSLYTLLGGRNIADGAESQYVQLSSEAIVEADPDVIVLVFGDPAEVAARPGWSGVTAVQNGHICLVDGDLLSRPGPRIMDGLAQLAGCLYPED
jgi:iron complex transport system substrate-binding protein